MTCDPNRPFFCRCRASLVALVMGSLMLGVMALVILFLALGGHAAAINPPSTPALPTNPALMDEN